MGGAGGGNTVLTEEGRRAIAIYRELRARLADLLKPETFLKG